MCFDAFKSVEDQVDGTALLLPAHPRTGVVAAGARI